MAETEQTHLEDSSSFWAPVSKVWSWSQATLLALFLAALSFSLTLFGVASAQEQEETPSGEAGQEEEAEEIVVTGSRIKRSEFESITPITVIRPEKYELTGLTSTADVLQGNPVTSGVQFDNTFGGLVIAGGTGVRDVDLRGIGAVRTLVLLNGKRFVPGGVRGQVGSVDLNSIDIPNIAIDQIEILKDGASSIYGADAVAGVVNYKTRKDLNGALIESSINFSTGTQQAGVAWGKVFRRGFILTTFNARNRERISQSEVAPDNNCPELIYLDPETGERNDVGDTYSNNRYYRNTLYSSAPDGQYLCLGSIYGFAVANRVRAAYDENADFHGTGLPFHNGLAGDPLGLRDTNEGVDDFRGRLTTANVYTNAEFDFKSTKLGFEFQYSRRESNSRGDARQFFPLVHPGRAGNPFVRTIITDGGLRLPLTRARPVILNRFYDETQEQELDIFRVLGYAEGPVTAKWDWLVSTHYGRNDSSNTFNSILADRVSHITGSTEGSQFVSAQVCQSIPECPQNANLFSADALLRGVLSQDVVDYIVAQGLVETTVNELTSFEAGITGTFGSLPGGPLATYIGVQWREEAIDNQPPLPSQAGNLWGFTSGLATVGEQTVEEAFVELELPIVADVPGAKLFTMNMSVRYSTYSSYEQNSTTWKIAAQWKPVDVFAVRFSRGTSFRTPTLYELFLGNQTGFAPFADPCHQYGEDFEPGDNWYENCQADGLAPDWLQQASTLIRTGGGAARPEGLDPETSYASNIGLVLRPKLRRGTLSIAFDRYQLEISDQIATPSVAFISSSCYNSVGKSDDYCARIGPRNVNINGVVGAVDFIDNSYFNIAKGVLEGADLTFEYRREYAAFDFELSLSVTRQLVGITDVDGADPVNRIGFAGYPEWQAQVQPIFTYGAWTFSWSANYIHGTSELDGRTTRLFVVEPQVYHNLSARYRPVSNRWSITAGVRNATGVKPPVLSNGVNTYVNRVPNTPGGVGYQYFGQLFFANASYRF